MNDTQSPPASESRRLPDTFVDTGSGEFYKPAPSEQATPLHYSETATTINVFNGDIREVVAKILGDGLGMNYVIDPAVQGNVTLRTAREVPSANMLGMLDAVLRLNGATLVETDDLIKVVPLTKAPSSGLSLGIGRSPSVNPIGHWIEVIPVRFVSVSQLVKLLQPFSSSEIGVHGHPALNLLLLVGSSDELSTLAQLALMFDVDWLAGMSFGLFPLEVARSTELIKELEQVFAGPLDEILHLSAIPRLNAILATSSQASYLERVEEWIERLDYSSTEHQHGMFVYQVKYADAVEMAEALTSVFAEAEGQTFLATGAQPNERAVSERAQLGAPAVIPNPSANALLIAATQRQYQELKAILTELDSVPEQVLIEATILEVSLNDQLQYGVEWFLRFGGNDIRFSSGSGEISQRFPGSSLLLTGADVRLVINALEEISDVRIVSSPQLLVLENETATIQVGDDVPVATQSAVDLESEGRTVVNTIAQVSTGTILAVKPRISATGLVVLEVEGSTSDAVPTQTSEIDSPTIRQRRVSSSIAVESGHTIVIGGLIRESSEKDRIGVPVLSRIPILGWLFGRSGNAISRTELLVLITPRVIGTSDEARAVTAELREKLGEAGRLDTSRGSTRDTR